MDGYPHPPHPPPLQGRNFSLAQQHLVTPKLTGAGGWGVGESKGMHCCPTGRLGSVPAPRHGCRSHAAAPRLQGSLRSSLCCLFSQALCGRSLPCYVGYFISIPFNFFPPPFSNSLCVLVFHPPAPTGDILRPGGGSAPRPPLCWLPPTSAAETCLLRQPPFAQERAKGWQGQRWSHWERAAGPGGVNSPDWVCTGPPAAGVQHRAGQTQKSNCFHGKCQQLQGQLPLLVLPRKLESRLERPGP